MGAALAHPGGIEVRPVGGVQRHGRQANEPTPRVCPRAARQLGWCRDHTTSMSSSSAPAPVATSPPSAPPSSASPSPWWRRSTGAVSASTSAASRPRRCCKNAELAHTLPHEKDKFGIEGDATMSYGPTHKRSREVSAGHRQGRPLPDEEEQDHRDRRLGHARAARPGSTWRRTATRPSYTCDNLIIATGATVRLLPGHRAQRQRRDLRGADPRRRAARLDHHRRLRRDRRRVRLRDEELRRRRDDRRVPRPDGARPRTPTCPRSCSSTTRSSA